MSGVFLLPPGAPSTGTRPSPVPAVSAAWRVLPGNVISIFISVLRARPAPPFTAPLIYCWSPRCFCTPAVIKCPGLRTFWRAVPASPCPPSSRPGPWHLGGGLPGLPACDPGRGGPCGQPLSGERARIPQPAAQSRPTAASTQAWWAGLPTPAAMGALLLGVYKPVVGVDSDSPTAVCTGPFLRWEY